MKKSVVLVAVLFLLSVGLYAQSAEKVSEILKTPQVTYGQVAYLAAVYQNKVSEGASYAQACETLKKAGIIPATVRETDVATLADVSFISADAAGLGGGLFYTLLHNKRYAYKELKAKGVLPQTADSDLTVSGRDALAVLNGCISLAGGAQ